MKTIKKEIKKQAGFTLIEILVVIGLIALLAAIVIIAINPARQFALGRDTSRTSNTNAILNAIGQFTADNRGVLPTNVPAAGAAAAAISQALCNEIMPKYIPSLPTDPQSDNKGVSIADCSTLLTTAGNYTVAQDNSNRITICAPLAAGETAISATEKPICVTR